MKKVLIFVFLLFLASPKITSFTSLAESKQTYYAKVQSSGTYLYSTPIDETNFRMFEIPTSYFVLLMEDENDNFYYAKYGETFGYVLKDSITPMNGTPKQPYAKKSFRVFSQVGLPLYSQPTTASSYEITLPYKTQVSDVYGYISGEEILESSTNQWIYCSFTQSGKKYFGYIFSYYCDLVSPSVENSEFFTEINGPLDFSPINTGPGANLSDTAKVLIAFSVIIPCLIILYLMLRPKDKSKQTSKHIIFHRPKRDYYEFNEDDLN